LNEDLETAINMTFVRGRPSLEHEEVVGMSDSVIPSFDSVTIDCPEPAALAGFYAALLDWTMSSASDDYVTIERLGGGTAITFQRAEHFTSPTWPDPTVPQQLHLDFAVTDLEGAHERAIALGARHLDSRDNFRVYADPVGHPFCICSW
jgi:predicted enzyme related to lactoylglutathione lyase